MKIAVQLFGHVRTYEKCYRSLHKHLLSHYDCDVFMHTWATTDHNIVTWHPYRSKKIYDTHTIQEKLRTIYPLSGLIIEEQIEQNLGTITVSSNTLSIHNIHSMFHSMRSVNTLREQYQKEHVIQYDFVIMLRPDIFLREDFIIESYIKSVDTHTRENALFTAGFPDTTLSYFPAINAIDLFFFARPHVLDTIYKQEKLFHSMLKPSSSLSYGPEYCFIQVAQQIGYTPILINYILKKDFTILRPVQRIRRKDICSIKIRKDRLRIYIFSFLLFQLLRFQCNIMNVFHIDICLGNTWEHNRNKKRGRRNA